MPVPLLVAFSFKNWLQVLFWDIREIKGDFSETDRSLDICSCHAHTSFLVNGGVPLKRETKRKKDWETFVFFTRYVSLENHYANGLSDRASESGTLMNNFRGKKRKPPKSCDQRERNEWRERTQTLTVLTKPPPPQVADPDVTLAWDTEPNPPFQTLGDTVYSVSHSNFLFIVS